MEEHFPDAMTIRVGNEELQYRKRTWNVEEGETGVTRGLRYGENPGQEAALYELVAGSLTLAQAKYVGPGKGLVSAIGDANLRNLGKHPGMINLADVDSALRILKYVDRPATAVMKHLNPCGVALGADPFDSLKKAYLADRLAAMGGCIVMNRPMDRASAEFLADKFVEVVAAPSFEEGVVESLAQQKSMRILEMPRLDRLAEYRDLRYLHFTSLQDGGLIVQQSFLNAILKPEDFLPAVATHKGREYRSRRAPTAEEYRDLVFGWAVIQGVTSNSVIYVKDEVTVAIGAGEQDRVGAAEHATAKAYIKHADLMSFEHHGVPYNVLRLEAEKGKRSRSEVDAVDEETARAKGGLQGSRMLSDAFFPFRDGVDVGLRQGITAVAHPGGSVRDHEVIEAANEADPPVAMVFTGQRCFRH